jgi:hypothetical protein
MSESTNVCRANMQAIPGLSAVFCTQELERTRPAEAQTNPHRSTQEAAFLHTPRAKIHPSTCPSLSYWHNPVQSLRPQYLAQAYSCTLTKRAVGNFSCADGVGTNDFLGLVDIFSCLLTLSRLPLPKHLDPGPRDPIPHRDIYPQTASSRRVAEAGKTVLPFFLLGSNLEVVEKAFLRAPALCRMDHSGLLEACHPCLVRLGWVDHPERLISTIDKPETLRAWRDVDKYGLLEPYWHVASMFEHGCVSTMMLFKNSRGWHLRSQLWTLYPCYYSKGHKCPS